MLHEYYAGVLSLLVPHFFFIFFFFTFVFSFLTGRPKIWKCIYENEEKKGDGLITPHPPPQKKKTFQILLEKSRNFKILYARYSNQLRFCTKNIEI